jgi:ribonuclease BN (tRNA processing enzyme)
MATELVLLGTAGAPMPVAGRGGISSALIVDGRVFVVDCGRGSPSAFAQAGLDFTRTGSPGRDHRAGRPGFSVR